MLRAHLPLPRSTILDTRVSNLLTLLVSAALFNTISLRADQVETQSGDRYLGKIIAVTANTVTIQNDVLGTVTVPRSKVTSITIGSPSKASTSTPQTHSTPAQVVARPASNAVAPADLSAAIRRLGTNSAAVRQVQDQYLSSAGPEANAKFN